MNEKLSDGKCPICGYNPEEPVNPAFLAPGTFLDGRYVIGKVIDSNGEGVTYLGYDTVTSSTVNIREFFPQGLCERDSFDGSVAMVSGNEFNYNDTLVKFIELSKTLFRLNELPALFDVIDVREANNTAYRITKSVPGISLREFLMRNGGMLKWDQARSLFAPLISSISALHKAGVIHRGISPDTLIVGKDGKVRINGFCIPEARMAKTVLSAQLFPGFAAVEQYNGAVKHGPWTDIYAFAATIYRTLVGNPPPESPARLQNDNMTIPAQIARETPKPVLESLANALQVLPDDRTHNIDEMRKGLSVSSAQVAAAAVTVPQTARTMTEPAYDRPKKKKKKGGAAGLYGVVAAIVTVCLLLAVVFFVLWSFGIFDNDDTSSGASRSSNVSGSSIDDNSVNSKIDIDLDEKYVLNDLVGEYYVNVENSELLLDRSKVKLVISHKEYSDTIPEGKIISQNPAPGTLVTAGKSTVEVVVSMGKRDILVRDLIEDLKIIGCDAETARIKLLEQGYRNIVIDNSIEDPSLPTGAVVRVIPDPEETITKDSQITLYANSYVQKVEDPQGSGTTTPENGTNTPQ
jgi:serine/threonine-protein kinase